MANLGRKPDSKGPQSYESISLTSNIYKTYNFLTPHCLYHRLGEHLMEHIATERLSTGVSGLDTILQGGLLPGRSYLLRGGPGTGKTTLGMQFLMAGVRLGESVLFISLEESEKSLRQNAETIGSDVKGIEFLDMSPDSDYFTQVQSYDIFSPSEVEREPVANTITEVVSRLNPIRVFLDPLTQLRYLSNDNFQFRKQVLSFLRFLTQKGATVVVTTEASAGSGDDDIQFMTDGIINLGFNDQGRSVAISKFRGSGFQGRSHTMTLDRGGVSVFPRLAPDSYGIDFSFDVLSSGLSELDSLLHGGIERGTVTFLSGPTGVGKTSLGCKFMQSAASRGERSVLFALEEEPGIMIERCEAIGIAAKAMIEAGTLNIIKIEPLKYSPDEFAQIVRHEVETNHTRIVMIDSVSGYRLSMQGQDLVRHLHSLTKYLQNMGVAVILAVETSQLTGDFRVTDYDISYLADNLIFLRYLEIDGLLRKAIGVLKKRLTDFEKTLREFKITETGIVIGQPLANLRGILTGTPRWKGPEK